MSVVGMSAAAKQLARLVATVVLPAPPFGLSTKVVFILARGSASPFSCPLLFLRELLVSSLACRTMMPCATANCKKSVKKFSPRSAPAPAARIRLSSTIAPRRTGLRSIRNETQIRLGARARGGGWKSAAPAGGGGGGQKQTLRRRP